MDNEVPLIQNTTNWIDFNKNELHNFDYRVLIAYDIPNKLIHLGPKKDGGYVIADGFDYDLLISCGISDNIGFEEAFLDRYKIKCVAFDGTIKSFPSNKNKMEWIPKNIGHANTGTTTNLKEYIQGTNKIFLKMDIEGSEFNWLDSMSLTELKQFSQIVIEFHWPFDIFRMNMLKKLNETHYIVHVHGNNYQGVYNINNSDANLMPINIPEVFEVTYVNKLLFNSAIEQVDKFYPIDKLDYGNNACRQIEFCIPTTDKLIYIGSSETNTKVIKVAKNIIFGHNMLNAQEPNWNDAFIFKIHNSDLAVTRTDQYHGWGQPLVIPIKHNTILVYNGLSHHYEMIGFILDFAAKFNIDVTIVLTQEDEYSWIDFYKSKYKFNILKSLPLQSELDHYLFVLLLTDDDVSFPEDYINKNTVCIHHTYKNRRKTIKYHLPIAPFEENIGLYSFPVFNYIDYDSKINILKTKNRPIISLIGFSRIPENIDILSMIDNLNDFDIYIINRSIPENLHDILPNACFFEQVSTSYMFELLVASTYVLYFPNNSDNVILQKNLKSISASFSLSFTTGCKLILPKEMNKFLKLTSIIEYSYGSKLKLDKTPLLLDTFNERERLVVMRDKSILDLEHMQMYFKCKRHM